jgi:hypothetical protein
MKKEQNLDSQKCIMFDLSVNAIKAAIIKGETKFKSYNYSRLKL